MHDNRSISIRVIAIILVLSHSLSCSLGVTISNNGYESITVALSQDMIQSSNANVIDKVRQLFTVASGYLYATTRRRAYFRQVTIVVPSSWSSTIRDQSVAVQDTFDQADIQIDSFYSQYSDIAFAYVLRTGACNIAGHAISVTPSWLDYSLAGRQMVRLWAQYRYGVFEEYAIRGQDLVYLGKDIH